MSGGDVGVVAVGVLVDADRVLLVRRGDGRAAGRWALPAVPPDAGETLAEAVVRALERQGGLEALCGPFLGWYEVPEAPDPHVAMCFQVVASTTAAPSPTGGDEAVEARLVPSWEVGELPLAVGQAEFLADRGIIELVL